MRLGLDSREAAQAVGVRYVHYLALESGRLDPLNRQTGEFRDAAKRIARYFGRSPQDLFYRAVARPTHEDESGLSDHAAAAALPPDILYDLKERSQCVRQEVDGLGPRRGKLVSWHFGLRDEGDDLLDPGMNCAQIARWEKISRGRAGLVLADSLRRLGRDKTLRLLWDFFDERPAPPPAVLRYAAHLMASAFRRDPPVSPLWGWYECGSFGYFDDTVEAVLRSFRDDWRRCWTCGATAVALLRGWNLIAFRRSRASKPPSAWEFRAHRR